MSWRKTQDAGLIVASGLKDFVTGLTVPTLRLGVTGLSRAGKTVFITSLVQALTKGTRLPLFLPAAEGRIQRCYLEPQPDDALPRFQYEAHLEQLEQRNWPESTSRISQLRLTIDYEAQSFLARKLGKGKLHIDIVDYPGEWLMDLSLMQLSYREWSAQSLASAQNPARFEAAQEWLAVSSSIPATAVADEMLAQKLAASYTDYLAKGRAENFSLSTLTPGRFLMPGDMAGSPLLTFAPLALAASEEIIKGSLAELMERRYRAYVDKLVRPFFFGHFARLDRQIVLVDVLTALNAGKSAVQDLQTALRDVLSCFRVGQNSFLTKLLGHRIDRILFAATKADQLHQKSHDRLQNILALVISDAFTRAAETGVQLESLALSAIRSTAEAHVQVAGEEMPCIVGTVQQGEKIDGQIFDGLTDAAIFPGDLPANSVDAINGALTGQLKFIRFRPPVRKNGSFPSIRLDRTIQFLVGDRLK